MDVLKKIDGKTLEPGDIMRASTELFKNKDEIQPREFLRGIQSLMIACPEVGTPYIHAGVERFSRGQAAEACPPLRRALKIDPNDEVSITYLLLALEQQNLGRALDATITEHLPLISRMPSARIHLRRWLGRYGPSEFEALFLGAVDRHGNQPGQPDDLLSILVFTPNGHFLPRLQILSELCRQSADTIPKAVCDWLPPRSAVAAADLIDHCRTHGYARISGFLSTGTWDDPAAEARPKVPAGETAHANLPFAIVTAANRPPPGALGAAAENALLLLDDPFFANARDAGRATDHPGDTVLRPPVYHVEQARARLATAADRSLDWQWSMIRSRTISAPGSGRSFPIHETIVLCNPDELRRGVGEIAVRIDPSARVYIILGGDLFIPVAVFDLDARTLFYDPPMNWHFETYFLMLYRLLSEHVRSRGLQSVTDRTPIGLVTGAFDYLSHYFYATVPGIDAYAEAARNTPADLPPLTVHGTDFIDLEAGLEGIWPTDAPLRIRFDPEPATTVPGAPEILTLPLSGISLPRQTSDRCRNYLLGRSSDVTDRFIEISRRASDLFIVFCHRIENKRIINNTALIRTLHESLARARLSATVFVHTNSAIGVRSAPIFEPGTGDPAQLPDSLAGPRMKFVHANDISFPDTAALMHRADLCLVMNSSGATLPLMMSTGQVVLFNPTSIHYDARAQHRELDCRCHEVRCESRDPTWLHSDYEVPIDTFRTVLGSAVNAVTSRRPPVS